MIPVVSEQDHLEELWTVTRRAGLRMLVRRQDPVATDDAVFILEIVDTDGRMIVEVTTKNLESAAAWILDQRRRANA